jgi:hypothetical protein
VLCPYFPANLHASETHRTVIKLIQLLNFTYLKNIMPHAVADEIFEEAPRPKMTEFDSI